MIYLIETDFYDKEKGIPVSLLKIGYTSDLIKRIGQYRTHNPFVKLLDSRKGNEELEKELHRYFKDYSYPGQPEWFYYNDKIIQEFKTYKKGTVAITNSTIYTVSRDYIKEIIKEYLIPQVDPSSSYASASKLYEEYVLSKLNFSKLPKEVNMGKVKVNLIVNWKNKNITVNVDQILKYSHQGAKRKCIHTIRFESDEQDFLEYANNSAIASAFIPIIQTVNQFRYDNSTFLKKMKYLCEEKDNLTKEEFDAVLNIVPLEYKNYITTLGVDKIKAKYYKKGALDKEFNTVCSNQYIEDKLREKINQEFKSGEKYSKAEIKEKLKKIYEELGYKKTPKASDLGKWISAKEAQWRDKNGKNAHGFEIE